MINLLAYISDIVIVRGSVEARLGEIAVACNIMNSWPGLPEEKRAIALDWEEAKKYLDIEINMYKTPIPNMTIWTEKDTVHIRSHYMFGIHVTVYDRKLLTPDATLNST